jgi:hypothetical protein
VIGCLIELVGSIELQMCGPLKTSEETHDLGNQPSISTCENDYIQSRFDVS